MDCAFINAQVLTMDANNRVAEAVAVRGRRLVAVGSNADIKAAINANYKVFNLAGGTLLPGFIDAHNHLTLQGAAMRATDFSYPSVSSVKELRQTVQQAAQKTAKGRWIRGWGMNYEKYPDGLPCLEDIDDISPDNPVCIVHVTGHFVLVNRVALKLAGVDDNTPNPQGGALIRDEHGRLTGLAQDSAQQLVVPSSVKVAHHGPDIGYDVALDELTDDIACASQAYLASGITSIVDAQVTTREMPGYIAARKDGKLGVRVTCMYLSNHVDAINELGITGVIGDDRLAIGPVKFYCDGTLIGGTALFYGTEAQGSECRCAPRGRAYWQDKAAFQEALIDTHRRGLQFGVHTQGDHAVDIVLDAVAMAQKKYPRADARHRIEHCHGATDTQVQKIKELGLLPITQPGQLYENGDDLSELYGNAKARNFCRLRAMLEANIPAVVSTDAFVHSYKPFHAISGAVNRISRGGKDMGHEQRITPLEAIKCYTANAAHSVFQEHYKGTIEVGKLADLIFIPGDISAVSAEEIGHTKVNMTMLNGEIVYGGV